MRIVGGRLKGRTLAAPGAQGGGAAHLRPTSDRVRESTFNLLAHGGFATPPAPEGMRALDLFAGTGALGCEALSRGAVWCVFVDDHGPSRALIRRNVETLGLVGAAKIWRRDALRLGPCRGAPFDLVFLDPPYRSGHAPKALAGAAAQGWLAEDALAVVELAADEPFAPPDGFAAAEDRRYGETRLVMLRRGDSSASA